MVWGIYGALQKSKKNLSLKEKPPFRFFLNLWLLGAAPRPGLSNVGVFNFVLIIYSSGSS